MVLFFLDKICYDMSLLKKKHMPYSNEFESTCLIIIIIKALFNLERNLSAFIKNAGLNKMSSNNACISVPSSYKTVAS